MNALKTFDV